MPLIATCVHVNANQQFALNRVLLQTFQSPPTLKALLKARFHVAGPKNRTIITTREILIFLYLNPPYQTLGSCLAVAHQQQYEDHSDEWN